MIQIENYFLFFLFALFAIFASFYFIRKLPLNNTWLRYIIGGLRFLSLFTLLVLLLSPILKCTKSKTIKPKIVLLFDNSRSIRNAGPDYIKEVKGIRELLNKGDYDIEVRIFDKKLASIDSLDLSGNRTNIYSALNETISSNLDANLNRIILITDGNYNEGNNPAFVTNLGMIPIDVVLVGDTARVSDYKIESIEYNNLMLQDEINPLNIAVSAYLTSSTKAKIILEELTSTGYRLINQTVVSNTKNNFSQSIQFKLSGFSKGKHNYRVSIVSNLKEKNLANNSREFSIDVIDGTKQIDVLASFPHPDLSALKSWLAANKSFKVNLNISETNLSFSDKADLIVLYQLPNQFNNGRLLFEKAKAAGKSVLFVLGTKSDFSAYNQLQECYKVNVMGNVLQDYGNRPNLSFSKFYLNEAFSGDFQTYPPLSNYLLTIESKANASHMLLSKLGRVDSDQPLISFSYQDNIQVGLIAAENIWKWRVSNYQTKKNFGETQDLIDKIVNYLAIKKDKKQLTVNLSNENLVEGDNFSINANTYNELYQPSKAEKVQCIITGGDLGKKSYEMLPSANSYSLSPKDLKAGRYMYEILAVIGGKLSKHEGSFSIMKNDLEDAYTASNYEDMYALTMKTGGEFYLWKNRMNIMNSIEEAANSKVKLVKETKQLKANDMLFLLIFILLALSAEWLLRKYFGLN